MKVRVIPIVIGTLGTIPKAKGLKESGNNRISGNHPDFCIIKIGQNTEKSPGDLRRLSVTQNPGKDSQLKEVRKTSKGKKHYDPIKCFNLMICE